MSEPSASEDRVIEALRALAEEGDASAHELLGEFSSRPGSLGRLDVRAAEAHFRAAYEIAPTETRAQGIARVLLYPEPEGDPVADRCDEAIALLEAHIPGAGRTHDLLARAYRVKGGREELELRELRAATAARFWPATFRLSRRLRERGRYMAAFRMNLRARFGRSTAILHDRRDELRH